MPDPTPILLIDDDEDDFFITREILDEVPGKPYTLDWCRGFEDGLATLRERQHAACLVDYRLGQHTGLDLIKKADEESLGCPMIMFTGAGDEETDHSAARAGAQDYLLKGELAPATLDRCLRYAIERVRRERQLSRQALILESVHDGVILVADDGTVLSWNAGAERIFGASAAQTVGEPISKACPSHPDLTSQLPTPDATPETGGVAEFDSRCWTQEGQEITVAVRATRLANEPAGTLICVRDATRERRLQRRLLGVAEDEQRRIGQDLHDDLCQQLSGIGCLAKVLENEIRESHQGTAEGLAQIVALVGKANTQAKQLARGLVPTSLGRGGLAAALRNLAEHSEEVFRVPCFFTTTGDLPDPPEEAGIHLYRIAQESITNAVRHSGAGHVHLRLSPSGDGAASLAIEDDGQGFDPTADTGGGLGIAGMRHRAEAIGANLEINSGKGGTLVRCTLPPAPEHATAKS